jgi:hypothetical protein
VCGHDRLGEGGWPVSSEMEPSDQSPAEMETEFARHRRVRLAALEYARGLQPGVASVSPDTPGGEDVQFIIIGIQQDGRNLVFASSAVTEAKFARYADGFDHVEIRRGGPVARVPREVIVVGAKLSRFEQVIGESYGLALTELLGRWRRADRARGELGPGDRS